MQLMPDLDPIREAYAVPPVVRKETAIILQRHPECRNVVSILKDISRLSQWITYQAARNPDFFTPKSKWCDSGVWILPFTHELLECKTVTPPTESSPSRTMAADNEGPNEPIAITTATAPTPILASLRHALILYLQPIRRKFGILTDVSSAVHLSSLRETLLSTRDSSLWHDLPTTLQWILAVGGMEAEDGHWYAAQLAELRAFREARDAEFGAGIRGFVWVDEVHDERLGRVVWRALEEMNRGEGGKGRGGD